jgi:hypothetical protein
MDTDSAAPLSPYAGLAAKIRPDGSRDAQANAAERALRQPILRIALRPGFILLRPFIEPCRVLVDGHSLGGLTSSTNFEAAVAAGQHTVRVVRGWLSSNVMDVHLANGDIAQFLCSGHNSLLDLVFGLAILFAAFLPRRFYWLKPFHR